MKKTNKSTMEVKRLIAVALEMFKTLNKIYPCIMKYVLTPKTDARVRPRDTLVVSRKTFNYGKILFPKI